MLSSSERDNLQRNYTRIIEDYERTHGMARREISGESSGTPMAELSDSEVRERFKLSETDYGKMPLLCRTALKDAMVMGGHAPGGATNLWFVCCTDYDGNQQNDIVSAQTGREAIRKYAEYHGYDEDTEFDDTPVAYRLPASAPWGIMRYGNLEQFNWGNAF